MSVTPTKAAATIGDQPAITIRHKGDGHWTVWLHVEAGHTERDYGGLCLAVSRDRVRAIGEALGTLNRLHDKLHHHLIHGDVKEVEP